MSFQHMIVFELFVLQPVLGSHLAIPRGRLPNTGSMVFDLLVLKHRGPYSVWLGVNWFVTCKFRLIRQ